MTWTLALTSTLQGVSTDTGDVQFYYFTVGKQHILSLTTQATAGATGTTGPDLGKVLNFAIIYGKTSWAVARSLRVDVGAAEDLLDEFHRAYPGVRPWADGVVREARARG